MLHALPPFHLKKTWFPALLCLLPLWTPAALATQGNIFAKGTAFHAGTYIDHPKYGTHSSYYGNSPEQTADINIGWSSWDDEGTPLLAPEDGTVQIVHNNSDSWGYSLEWRTAQGTERLFLAHLKSIVRTGPVKAGEQIAELGGTGGWNPHLHLESAGGWIVLSGRELRPQINPPHGNGMLYVSDGPAAPARQPENGKAAAAPPRPSGHIVTMSAQQPGAVLPDAPNSQGVYDLSQNSGSTAASAETMPPATPRSNAPPVGRLEKAGCTIAGWAKDPDAVGPVDVLLYVDGTAPEHCLAAVRADIGRPDLPSDDLYHGFAYPVPARLRSGRRHVVSVYALDSAGGQNPLLGQAGFICPPDTAAPSEPSH